MLKSVFDKSAAFCGLALLSPLMLGITLAIKLEDGGPVFFKQERVGKGGRPFVCYKFRTMHHEAEALLQRWKDEGHPNWAAYVESNFKLKNDPRVTRVGQFLRRTSFDELAQLWNVLRGNMSLVGPRPLLEREVADYGAQRFALYCEMTPGLSGLWQVSGRSDTSFDKRAELDMAYYSKRTFFYDLLLIAKTFKVLLRRDGAY